MPPRSGPQQRDELSAAQAAARIGCSRGFVYILLKEGRLSRRYERPYDAKSRYFLSADEVRTFASEWKRSTRGPRERNKEPRISRERGRLAAILFPLFEARVALADICTRHSIAPEVVREFYCEWMTPIEESPAMKQRRAEELLAKEERARDERQQSRADWREHRQRMAMIEASGRRAGLPALAIAPRFSRREEDDDGST